MDVSALQARVGVVKALERCEKRWQGWRWPTRTLVPLAGLSAGVAVLSEFFGLVPVLVFTVSALVVMAIIAFFLWIFDPCL